MDAIKLATAIAVALLVQACGGSSQDESKLDGAEDDSLLVVVSGGNSSCKPDGSGMSSPYGMDMYENFAAVKEELQGDGRSVSFLLTCHGSNSTVFYVSSDDERSMQQTTLDGFGSEVVRLRNAREPKKIYLAGHSYGGWLAMKAVQNFAFDVAGLYTIDPISRTNCSFSQPLGCQSAPADITTAQRDLLAERSGHWENFYQTTTSYLHSSAISQADINTKLGVGHTVIDSHTTVWSNIAASMRQRRGSETLNSP